MPFYVKKPSKTTRDPVVAHTRKTLNIIEHIHDGTRRN